MATTYTLEDLARIERAIVSGSRRVKFADREVEFRSLTELRGIAEEIRRALGLSVPGFHLEYHRVRKDLE